MLGWHTHGTIRPASRPATSRATWLCKPPRQNGRGAQGTSQIEQSPKLALIVWAPSTDLHLWTGCPGFHAGVPTRDGPVVSGCGYATPLVCASRSASNRRICSSGGTEPGVVSCRRIASLIALVAAAADFSASEGPGRGWFGVSLTLRCRIHCLLPAGLGRHVACVPGVRAHQCVRIGESRDTHSPTNDANRRPSVVRSEEGVSQSTGGSCCCSPGRGTRVGVGVTPVFLDGRIVRFTINILAGLAPLSLRCSCHRSESG